MEQEKLKHLEKVIKDGWATFLNVGSALITINEEKLYRDKYETFEAYFRDQLGLSRSYTYNLMGSAKVYEQMSSIEDIGVKPLTESHLRELISVPTEKRADAWRGALKLAGEKPLTAKIVHQAAAEFKPKGIGKATKAAAKPVNRKLNLKPAIKLLDEIEKLAAKNKGLLAKVSALRKCLQKIIVS